MCKVYRPTYQTHYRHYRGRFLPRCIECNAVIGDRKAVSLSVHPSVRPSYACIVTKRTKVLPPFLYHMKGRFIYTVSQKRPAFKLSVTLSNLNRFSNILHCWKAYKIRYKISIRHYPPHLTYVATLPWEIRNSNFLQIFSRYGRKCKQIAF